MHGTSAKPRPPFPFLCILIHPCVYEAFGGHGIGGLRAYYSQTSWVSRSFFLAQVDDETRQGDDS